MYPLHLTFSLTGWLPAFEGVPPCALPFSWPGLGDELAWQFADLRSGLVLESPDLPSHPGNGGAFWPGVGVIGFPPFISSTISSASRERSPSGLNGLSQPLSVLKSKDLPRLVFREKYSHSWLIYQTSRNDSLFRQQFLRGSLLLSQIIAFSAIFQLPILNTSRYPSKILK